MRFIPPRLVWPVAAANALVLGSGGCGRDDRIDAMIREHMEKDGIPAVAFAVVRDGKLARAQAYGVADVELQSPATTDTVFRLQSLSKQFTAAGALLLVEEGRIAVEDPVGRHLDDCPDAWASLTIQHLLTQTSGLPDFINDRTVDFNRLDLTDEQIFESVAARPLQFEPGTIWDYSNTNYHLLAMIIQRVSGQWYGDFLNERVFQPLGMTRTAVLRDGEIVSGRASGYSRQNGSLRPAAVVAPAVSGYGGGGVRSTVLDLVRWDLAMTEGRFLTRKSWNLMATPVTLNNGLTHSYGFGWELDPVHEHRRMGHGGRFLGFSARMDRFVDDGLTVIVLTNLFEGSAGTIAQAIAGEYVSELASSRREPIEDTDPELTQQLLDVLRRAADGRLRAEDFTAETWPFVEPLAGQLQRDMASFGALESLTLLERTPQADGTTSYRYRARFARTTFTYHFVITRGGRLATMMPEEVAK